MGRVATSGSINRRAFFGAATGALAATQFGMSLPADAQAGRTGPFGLFGDREMPSLAGATGWINTAPLDSRGAARESGPRPVLDLHLHQLAARAPLRPRVVHEIQGPGPRGARRAHARVPVRRRHRERPPRSARHADRLPGRGRQRLRDLACVQEPVLAGLLLRRCAGAHPPPSVRRGRIRTVGEGPSSAAGRGRRQRHRPRTGCRGWPAAPKRRPIGPT